MIATSHLFLPLHDELILLLRNLDADGWQRPTVAGAWWVQDVAAHLLDGMLRRLAAARDGHLVPPSQPLETAQDFVDFVNSLNADWVRATRRLSPRILTDLLEPAGRELAAYLRALDPLAPAFWPVSWAGQDASPNWLDIGRDYTEQWHHQQQIRLATGQPLQLDRRFGYPALALFVLAVPVAYRDTAATMGTEVEILIRGDAGAHFTLHRLPDRWAITERSANSPAARLMLNDSDAWLLFTKGLKGDAATAAIAADGPAELCAPFLRSLAIVG